MSINKIQKILKIPWLENIFYKYSENIIVTTVIYSFTEL